VETRVTVNDLLLPRDLLTLMDAGRWKAPLDPSGVDRLFPENGGLHPYSVEVMESETRSLSNLLLQGQVWQPDPDNIPGDIDFGLAVVVADLGTGYDQPIALDYRVSQDWPRVITLRWSERGKQNHWVVVAQDIMAFAELVGL
jgi:hypothetical protein